MSDLDKPNNKDILMQMVTFFFARTHYEQPNNIHIPIPLKQIITKFSKRIFPSTILSLKQDVEFYALLANKSMHKISHRGLKLIYRGSQHNFTPMSFHKACDGHGPTITIIQSKHGNIFGGFADVKWPEIGGMRTESENIFLFLINSNDKSQQCPIIFPGCSVHNYIKSDGYRGPIFDGGHRYYHEFGIGFNDESGTCHSNKSDGFDYGSFKTKDTEISGARSDDNLVECEMIDYEVFEISSKYD